MKQHSEASNSTGRCQGGQGCQNLARVVVVGKGCRQELRSSLEKCKQF